MTLSRLLVTLKRKVNVSCVALTPEGNHLQAAVFLRGGRWWLLVQRRAGAAPLPSLGLRGEGLALDLIRPRRPVRVLSSQRFPSK